MTAVKFDVLRYISNSSIGGSFSAVGTPLSANWRIMKITNNLDCDVIVSTDGVNANIFVPAFGFVLYDFSTNEPAIAANDNMVIGKGTQFYAQSVTTPTTGFLYIEGVYS